MNTDQIILCSLVFIITSSLPFLSLLVLSYYHHLNLEAVHFSLVEKNALLLGESQRTGKELSSLEGTGGHPMIIPYAPPGVIKNDDN